MMAAAVNYCALGVSLTAANGGCHAVGWRLAQSYEAQVISVTKLKDRTCRILLKQSGTDGRRLICAVDPATFWLRTKAAPTSPYCLPFTGIGEDSVEDYWTDERMKNAKPMDMGVVE